jgi:hypothetical protein
MSADTRPSWLDGLAPECKALGECKRNYSGPMPGCEGVCLLRYPNGKAKAVDPLDALVASPRFEWMPGMALTDGYRINAVCSERHEQDEADDLGGWLLLVCIEDMAAGDHASSYWGRAREPDIGPDLDDEATCGCLLALVRKAWGPDVAVQNTDGPRVRSTTISNGSGRVLFHVGGKPTGERLAAALLAAPVKAGEP